MKNKRYSHTLILLHVHVCRQHLPLFFFSFFQNCKLKMFHIFESILRAASRPPRFIRNVQLSPLSKGCWCSFYIVSDVYSKQQ